MLFSCYRMNGDIYVLRVCLVLKSKSLYAGCISVVVAPCIALIKCFEYHRSVYVFLN